MYKRQDKYNEFIKKNVDALSQQKINVGNYQGSAKIIVDALEKEKKKLEELIKAREKLVNVQNAGSTFKPTVVEGFASGQPTASAGGGGAIKINTAESVKQLQVCLLYTSPSPRDRTRSRMPSSA